MSSFKVSVGNAKPVRVKNIRDAWSVVATAVTSLMARDPEAMARGAIVVDAAFESGAAEYSVIAHGIWSITLTMDGVSVLLAVRKHWW